MKRLFISGQLLVFALFFNCCASQFSISVIAPDDKIDDLNVYLLTSEQYISLQNVKTQNSQYFASKLLEVNDSLKILLSRQKFIINKMIINSEICSTLSERLPVEYCSNVSVKPVQISKYGDVWQLSVVFNNTGNEDIWGLFLTVKYKSTVIVNHVEFPLFIQPNQQLIFNNINFDLSGNIPLQYSMATYPGGLNKLLEEAIVIDVESVKSMFANSLSDCYNESNRLEQEFEDVSFAIDVYNEQLSDYLYSTIVKPVNIVLENNLRRLEKRSVTVTQDTIKFNSIDKGSYELLVYTNADSIENQYLIPLELANNPNSIIDLKNHHNTMFFLNKKGFLDKIRK